MPELPEKALNFLLDQIIKLIMKPQALSGSMQPEMEVFMFWGKLGFRGRTQGLLNLCQRCSPKARETPDIIH